MVTLTTADNALKEVYLGVVSNQLNTSINPLLAQIKQTTADVWGKDIVKLAPYGLNGGIGAGTEDGELPAAGGNNYAKFVLTLKNLYGKIDISDKAIRASENSAGAFVNLLNSEMEGLIKASSFNFGRMLYGDGTGVVATISANTTSAITVDRVANLMEGMIVDAVDASTGVAVSGATGMRIVSIDRANKIVVVDKTLTANALAAKALCVQGSYGKELTGLGAIFKSTGSLYGLNRATYGWLVPYMKDITTGTGESATTTQIDDIVIQTAIDTLEEDYDSKVDFIVCSAGVKRNYQYYLANYRSNIDVMELAGGYKAISYNGIPVVSDRFAPANTMYLLNTKEFNLHQLCDWKWLEGEDGRVIKQNAGRPTYSATLVKYADIICNKPSGQAMITGIKES
ncbi:MAG: phage major capsid protein [Clostridia bacterium]|nr:phage major capsid protein [Clostridia bacterium]